MRDTDLKQRLKSVARAQAYWQQQGWQVGDDRFDDQVSELLTAVKLAALEEPIDPQSMPEGPRSKNPFFDIDDYQDAELEREAALKLAREQAGLRPQPYGAEAKELERKTQAIAQYIVEHGGLEGPQAQALRGLADWMGRTVEGVPNLDYNGLPIPFDYFFWLDLTTKLGEPARQLALEKIGVPTP